MTGETGGIFVWTNDLKHNLTEVRLLNMFNKTSETIASLARNRLCARLKCPWSYVREVHEIFDFGLVGDAGKIHTRFV